MKVYFHLNIDTFSNTYVVVDEHSKCAVIIDPGKPTNEVLKQIETDGYRLCAALITHNHEENIRGLKTLKRIYDFNTYAADIDVATTADTTIKGEGILKFGGIAVEYFALPGHTADSIVYKIGSVLFTGDVISAGEIGSTTSSYAKELLCRGIQSKIFTQNDDTVIMSSHGPMTSVAAEKMYNLDAATPQIQKNNFFTGM
ncbi:MAG: MBL fold metallo-hydrolase [Treponema sp.]|nr:MBL fold metallo-hydrolase [Treponema sp.]